MFVYFLVVFNNFLNFFLSILMVIISLELTRVNPDRNIFSINVELTSTFLLYRGLVHHHSRGFKINLVLVVHWGRDENLDSGPDQLDRPSRGFRSHSSQLEPYQRNQSCLLSWNDLLRSEEISGLIFNIPLSSLIILYTIKIINWMQKPKILKSFKSSYF